jgi:hypothetical protein
MPVSQDQVDWIRANGARLVRCVFIPQLLVALVLLGLSYRTGKDFVHLLRKGARTQGKIVGFQPVLIQTHRNPSSTGSLGRMIYLPVVEFRVNDRLVRFREQKLLPNGEGVGWSVTILYDPSDPSIAMVDRASWNWLPWAPFFAMGFVVGLAGLKGFFDFLFRQSPELNLSPSS